MVGVTRVRMALKETCETHEESLNVSNHPRELSVGIAWMAYMYERLVQ